MFTASELLERINSHIAELQFTRTPQGLYAPVTYVLSMGGKRIRPVLMLMAYNLYQEDITRIFNPATGIEVYHNYTLLHDDLMDRADRRRGKETVHKVWDDNAAILSGDAMLVLAYQFMAQCPVEHLKEVMDIFSLTALEICEGQQLDMEFEHRKDVKAEEYLEMIRLKTSVLLAASLKIGALLGGASSEDAGILTVKGGTNAIIEYFGPGTASLSATGKATICNMGAEVGATTSLFPYDERMGTYLKATGREEVAKMAASVAADLRADDEVLANPEKYYDRIIEIDLSLLEPYINGPFTPDAATPISKFAEVVITNNYPRRMEVGLIGSCTNSSYQDLSRAASLARQVKEKNLKVASPLIVNPGSEQIRATAERDGMIAAFEDIGATIMANACGPCIGQWKRHTDDPERKNSIVTSFNRNFAKRADGNPNTFAYVASPEITMALTIAGDLCFDPLRDTLVNAKGEVVKLSEPVGEELP